MHTISTILATLLLVISTTVSANDYTITNDPQGHIIVSPPLELDGSGLFAAHAHAQDISYVARASAAGVYIMTLGDTDPQVVCDIANSLDDYDVISVTNNDTNVTVDCNVK